MARGDFLKDKIIILKEIMRNRFDYHYISLNMDYGLSQFQTDNIDEEDFVFIPFQGFGMKNRYFSIKGKEFLKYIKYFDNSFVNKISFPGKNYSMFHLFGYRDSEDTPMIEDENLSIYFPYATSILDFFNMYGFELLCNGVNSYNELTGEEWRLLNESHIIDRQNEEELKILNAIRAMDTSYDYDDESYEKAKAKYEKTLSHVIDSPSKYTVYPEIDNPNGKFIYINERFGNRNDRNYGRGLTIASNNLMIPELGMLVYLPEYNIWQLVTRGEAKRLITLDHLKITEIYTDRSIGYEKLESSTEISSGSFMETLFQLNYLATKLQMKRIVYYKQNEKIPNNEYYKQDGYKDACIYPGMMIHIENYLNSFDVTFTGEELGIYNRNYNEISDNIGKNRLFTSFDLLGIVNKILKIQMDKYQSNYPFFGKHNYNPPKILPIKEVDINEFRREKNST